MTLKQRVFDGMLATESLNQLAQSGLLLQAATPQPVTDTAEHTGFSLRLISAAASMAPVFVVFFCIENAARELINQVLTDKYREGWWDLKVPTKIKTRVEDLKSREEVHRYHAVRSSENLGYTLFGDLKDIVIANWTDFPMFPDQAWVSSRFNDLEKSRNIIMHTGILPEEEVARVNRIAKDWVAQVG